VIVRAPTSASTRLRVGTKTLTGAINGAEIEVTRLTDELNKGAATIGVPVLANELVEMVMDCRSLRQQACA